MTDYWPILAMLIGFPLVAWYLGMRTERERPKDQRLVDEMATSAHWHDLYDTEHRERKRFEHELDDVHRELHHARVQRDALLKTVRRLRTQQERAQRQVW